MPTYTAHPPAYSLWQNDLTGVIFRVPSNGSPKKAISGIVVILEQYFLTANYGSAAAVIAHADTSDLRAWLDSR